MTGKQMKPTKRRMVDRLLSRFLPKAQEPGIAAFITQCRAER
jgi:hypothetical protein